MEILNGIIGPSMALIGMILFLFPKLRESSFIKRLLVAFFVTGCLVTFFTSAWYLHLRNFDEKKLSIFFQQQPHIIEADNNHRNSFILIIENKYKKEIKIKNLNVIFNSTMPLLDHKILLSDCDKDLVKIDIRDKSNLSLKVKEFRGGQIICLNFVCNSFLGRQYNY
jgi:hypothetical protein